MRKILLGIVGASLALALSGPGLLAQSLEAFGVGATVGLTNSVDHEFRLQNFDTHDANVWAQYQMEEDVLLRGTFGSLNVRGHNAGQPGTIGGGAAVALPDLRDRVDYATVSVAYEFRASGWDTGVFGGVGGYRIRPESTDPAFSGYRDARETVWGVHLGVESDFQVWQRLSAVARITYHAPQTHPLRKILTANLGLLYRF